MKLEDVHQKSSFNEEIDYIKITHGPTGLSVESSSPKGLDKEIIRNDLLIQLAKLVEYVEAKKAKKIPRPTLNINACATAGGIVKDLIRPIEEACNDYFNMLEEGRTDKASSDGQHYIFEAAMTALYGEEVWEYINQEWE